MKGVEIIPLNEGVIGNFYMWSVKLDGKNTRIHSLFTIR